MIKLIDKLNPINAILRLLFRVTWKPFNGAAYFYSDFESKEEIYDIGESNEEYGWHNGFPWGVTRWTNEIFTTYGEWEWKPNSRIDFYMSLDKHSNEKDNTAAWGIRYYEWYEKSTIVRLNQGYYYEYEQDPSMHEIDVIEVVKSNKLMFHVHTISGYPWGKRIQRGCEMKVPKGFDVTEKHLYSVKWVVKRFLGMKFVYIIHLINNKPVQLLTNLFSRIPDRSIYPAISYGEDSTEWVQYKNL